MREKKVGKYRNLVSGCGLIAVALILLSTLGAVPVFAEKAGEASAAGVAWWQILSGGVLLFVLIFGAVAAQNRKK